MSGKVIIGIHGLSNKPPASVVEVWWQRAIIEGLRVTRHLDISAVDFDLVYWADLLYPAPLNDETPYVEAAPGALKRYEEYWWEPLASQALEMGGDMLYLFKRLTGMDTLAEGVLRRKLVDLYRYYTDHEVREALRARVIETLMRHQGERIMLIAHSMGSIIAYDALRKLGRQGEKGAVHHLVTIGSPLGLPHVKWHILQEYPLMRTPTMVQQWTNLADRRDPVALDVALASDYAPNDYGVRVVDQLVLNDVEGLHHAAHGYLRTPECTDILRAFL